MTALTNEIIGLVLVVAAIVVVLVVRHLLLASRRTQVQVSAATGEAGTPETRVRPLEPASSVRSAFGPAPVWAGGSPPGSPAGADGGDQRPPELLPLSALRPASSARAVLPPPVTMTLPPGSALGPETEPEPSSGLEPESGRSPGQDRDPAQEAVITDRTGDEPPSLEVVAVPGNSAHASRVMHVSNLRASAAREIPTTWVVVTPMDLLGDPPPQPRSGEPGLDSAAIEVAPAPAADPVAVPVPEPTLPPEMEQPEPPLSEEPILLTPNPFGPSRVGSSQVDLGMPSSLLADLLGSDESAGEYRPRL